MKESFRPIINPIISKLQMIRLQDLNIDKIDFIKVQEAGNKIASELNENLEKRFPKDKRDELVDRVLTNLRETREIVEARAKVLAERSKDNPIVLNYLRPIVQSDKTKQVLNDIESRVSTVGPVIKKLQSLREQFLNLTAPKTETVEVISDEPTKRKRRPRKAKAE